MSVGTKGTNVCVDGELTPILSTRYALSWQHAAIVAFFAFSFLLISHLPVSLHSVWMHANHGRWITQNGIPDTLPNAAYADGIPYIATTWLSDVATAVGIQKFGLEYISTAAAILTTLSMGLWCWLCFRQAKQKRFVLLAAVVLLLVWSFGLSALRGQTYAGVLLPVLLWLVWPADNKDRTLVPSSWIGACAILVLWANLDTSFFLGVSVLVCVAVGQCIESAKRTQSVREVLRDAVVQRSILLAEAGVVATLLSPRGWQTWASVLQLNGRGPLWSVAGGGFGLQLATVSGLVFAALCVFLIGVWQLRQQSIRARDVLLFLIVVVAAALNAMNLYWLAPIVLFLVARHWHGLAVAGNRTSMPKGRAEQEYHPMLFAWTLLSGLAVWCSFAFSPISAPLLSAKPRTVERILDRSTPTELGYWLKSNGQGFICAPADWSEWFAWTCGGEREFFVNSRLRHFPAAVQRDYARILQADKEWDNLTKQYNIGTLVIDKQRQPQLAKEAIRSGRWELARETDRSMVVLLRDE